MTSDTIMFLFAFQIFKQICANRPCIRRVRGKIKIEPLRSGIDTDFSVQNRSFTFT